MKKAIVYASNGGDRQRLSMSIHSVRKYIPDADIFVLTTVKGIHKDVTVIDPTRYMEELGLNDRGWNRKWPFATLYRLALPLVEELKAYEKILYLDTDVLIRSAEAGLIWDVDSQDYEVLGAYDCDIAAMRHISVMDNDLCEDARESLSKRLWIPKSTRAVAYINAGVILWNLHNINKNGDDWYRQRIRWFWEAETRGKLKYLDQDFINVMLDKGAFLSKGLNFFGGDENTVCMIQHFVAGTKRNMEKVARKQGWKG